MTGAKIKEAREYLEQWLVRDEGDETRAFCPKCEEPGASHSPSASFNFGENKWNCLKTDEHGGSIETLIKKIKTGEVSKVIRRNVSKAKSVEVTPFPYTEGDVLSWHEDLLADSGQLVDLEWKRGWSKDVLVDLAIGYDGERYTIPIYDAGGELVNVRRYKPGATDIQKMLNVKGHGTARIYGLDTLKANDEIIWCAGEPDRILALTEGFAAVTSTGGEGYFNPEWAPLFVGKTVYVCYDADKAGREGADKAISFIRQHAKATYKVTLDELWQGYDITDVIMNEGAKALRELISDAELVSEGVPHDVRSRFPRLDLAQLLRDDRPAREYVLEGLIPAGTSVSLVAPAGTGKSLFALAATIAVARGDENFAGLKITKRRVAYVDMENTEDDLADRLPDLGVTLDEIANLDDLVYLHLPSLPGLDTAEGSEALKAILDAYSIGKGDVLVLDSTQRVTEGPEDKSDTMRAFFSHTGLMLKQRGITVIRTDNTGHTESGRARGSSGKKDDVDIELIMERIGGGRFTIKPGKVRVSGINAISLEQHIDEAGQISYEIREEQEGETKAMRLESVKQKIVANFKKRGEFDNKDLIIKSAKVRAVVAREALNELIFDRYVSEKTPYKLLKDYPVKLKVETEPSHRPEPSQAVPDERRNRPSRG